MGKNTNDELNDWKVTTDRFVAFIDIMGFKDLVARSTHEDIYEMMKKIQSYLEKTEKITWNNIDAKHVKSLTFSDSIVVFSKDDSHDSLHAIVCTISVITQDLFREAIPHKGAMAFGKISVDTRSSVFFGQPLIDAYLLQEELNFYGFVLHGSTENKIDNGGRKNDIPFLLNYPCQFKGGVSNSLTIHPMFVLILDKKYQKEHDGLFKGISSLKYKTSGSLRKYIDATEIYLKKVKENYKVK